MDYSKKYIRMCKEAEEIQKLKSYRPAELSFFTRSNIWLPRQDQLQEMIIKVVDWVNI